MSARGDQLYATVDPHVFDSSHLDPLSDAELLHRYKFGEDPALEVLMDRHSEGLYRFCCHLVNNREDAEDICQEAIARAITRVDSLQNGSSFKSWLYSIARNLAMDSFRGRKRTCAMPDDEDGPTMLYEDNPQDRIEISEEHQTVAEALGKLAKSHQQVLMMREVQGMSYAAIATQLDVSQSAVETLLFRARRRLREEYGKRIAVPAVTITTGLRGLLARLASPMAGAPLAAKLAAGGLLLGATAVTVPHAVSMASSVVAHHSTVTAPSSNRSPVHHSNPLTSGAVSGAAAHRQVHSIDSVHLHRLGALRVPAHHVAARSAKRGGRQISHRASRNTYAPGTRFARAARYVPISSVWAGIAASSGFLAGVSTSSSPPTVQSSADATVTPSIITNGASGSGSIVSETRTPAGGSSARMGSSLHSGSSPSSSGAPSRTGSISSRGGLGSQNSAGHAGASSSGQVHNGANSAGSQSQNTSSTAQGQAQNTAGTVQNAASSAGSQAQNTSSSTQGQVQNTANGAQSQAQNTAGQVQNAANSAGNQAQSTANGAGNQVKSAAGQAGGAAGNTAGQVTNQAGSAGSQATSQTSTAVGQTKSSSGQAAGQTTGQASSTVKQTTGSAGQTASQTTGQAASTVSQTKGSTGPAAGGAQTTTKGSGSPVATPALPPVNPPGIKKP